MLSQPTNQKPDFRSLSWFSNLCILSPPSQVTIQVLVLHLMNTGGHCSALKIEKLKLNTRQPHRAAFCLSNFQYPPILRFPRHGDPNACRIRGPAKLGVPQNYKGAPNITLQVWIPISSPVLFSSEFLFWARPRKGNVSTKVEPEETIIHCPS